MTLRQHIRFCRTADGTRIAVAEVGSGPPLLRAAHWLSHVEYDLESPIWRHWLEALAARNRFVRYDQRGCGLSDREVTNFSLDAWLADMEAVADTMGPEPFPVIGMSQGGAVAIRFALRHPGRVSRLILLGAYARGGLRRGNDPEIGVEAETLVNLIRLGWGRNDPVFGQAFSRRFVPGGTDDQIRWWSEMERRTSSPETAIATLRGFQRIDVTEEAQALDLPVLILHARGDACVPFAEGRLLATLIPGARFVPLESDNHVLLPDEPAWRVFDDELHGFLGADAAPDAEAADAGLTPAEAEVLTLVAEGLDNAAIAERLGKSAKTVRNQVSVILHKLGVGSRSEAIVRARRHLER
ncbi:alpha/beta fold hydrolase [Psychromarinibacter sp. C21-152]|uniref:Alpha/beta fold hydrolase n=1 Tax=Psychromarinibacter sediminicola TaxID=3033385 RepID=A0AAE3NS54_9RHOB|nr:alpha/beta fold hydrolase [Psychromarinibacter sediminicola]MDF0601474.1 alpha/beta fold hydrolase [Psychromarinibacter sediminicola]